MIVLDSYNKIDILYRNYVKQFSSAYIKSSNLYVGESLKSSSNFNKSILVQRIIKTYKKNFIQLYMNSNKIHDELIVENICLICLEPLNESIIDMCHKCNVKCHINCLYDWYKKQDAEICPICLQTENYYLNLLNNNNNPDNPDNPDNTDNPDNPDNPANIHSTNIQNEMIETRNYMLAQNTISETDVEDAQNIINEGYNCIRYFSIGLCCCMLTFIIIVNII